MEFTDFFDGRYSPRLNIEVWGDAWSCVYLIKDNLSPHKGGAKLTLCLGNGDPRISFATIPEERIFEGEYKGNAICLSFLYVYCTAEGIWAEARYGRDKLVKYFISDVFIWDHKVRPPDIDSWSFKIDYPGGTVTVFLRRVDLDDNRKAEASDEEM